MQRRQTPASRNTWLIIFGALCASILPYGLIVWLLMNNAASSGVPISSEPLSKIGVIILHTMGATMLVAAVAFMQISTARKIGWEARVLAEPVKPVAVMEAGEFQAFSIVAMALSEAGTIFGLLLFFLSGEPLPFLYFAAGTLLVNLLFILPRGLKYWSNLAVSEKEESETPFSS